jgi:hypothetical protein
VSSCIKNIITKPSRFTNVSNKTLQPAISLPSLSF